MVRPNLDSHSIVFDPKNPNIVYEGGANGVFKSTDGGANWRTINDGLTNVGVNVLAIDPVTTTTIYAGTAGGIFRSVDGGKNWKAIYNNVPDPFGQATEFVSLAINPINTQNVFAGSDYQPGQIYIRFKQS
jgi:photosystem II stability/assembly factor-like uncharacterized protein